MIKNSMPVREVTDEMQEFPRLMAFEFSNDASNPSLPAATLRLIGAEPNAFPNGPILLGSGKFQGYAVGSQLGSVLTDNSPIDDGYRFHDAFHIGIMAKLGWSPVMRALLGVKRRRDPHIDEIEDGARAIIFEESLFDFLGMNEVKDGSSVEEDIDVLFASLALQKFFRSRSLDRVPPRHEEISDALLEGARLFHNVRQNLGGIVVANLDDKTTDYRLK